MSIEKLVKKLFGKKEKAAVKQQPAAVQQAPSEPVEPYKLYKQELQRLEKRAEGIEESGCGCSRHGARNFIGYYAGYEPETALAAYFAARDPLMSHCRSTGGSYTSSNIATIDRTIEVALRVAQKAKGASREEFIWRYQGLIRDLERNLRGEAAKKHVLDDATVVSDRFAKEGDHYAAALLLKITAGCDALQQVDAEKEVAKALAGRYASLALGELVRQKPEYKEMHHKVKTMLQNGLFIKPEVEKRAQEMLSRLEGIMEPEPEHMKYRAVEEHFWKKLGPLQEKVREAERKYERTEESIKADLEKQLEPINGKIKKYKSMLGSGIPEREEEIQKLITGAEGEVLRLKTKAEESKATQTAEIIGAIEPVKKERDALDARMKGAVEGIKARAMPKQEYKALMSEIRKYKFDSRYK